MRWGIIGPGNIAHDFARDLKLVTPSQQITAVLGLNPETTGKFVEKFEAGAAYTDLERFLQHESIDAVYIATPHPQHFNQALACLQHNIPVLCEKPLTLNADQAKDLVTASKWNKTFLMEGMWIRFLPSIRQLLELINKGTIGKVISVKASMGYKAPVENDNRYFNPELGGGSLLDLGIYPVFLSQLLLGAPTTIKAIGTLTETGVDESCSILMDYEGSAQAIIDSSIISQSDRPAEIAGEKGIIRMLHPWFEKCPGIEVQLYNQEKQLLPVSWEGHGLQFEIAEVMRCLGSEKTESALLPHAFSIALSDTLDKVREQIGVVYKEYE